MRPQEPNLLVIFDVIMTENSITRAAEQGNAISMLWHKRQNNDAGLKWLRQQIEESFLEQWNQAREKQDKLCGN